MLTFMFSTVHNNLCIIIRDVGKLGDRFYRARDKISYHGNMSRPCTHELIHQQGTEDVGVASEIIEQVEIRYIGRWDVRFRTSYNLAP